MNIKRGKVANILILVILGYMSLTVATVFGEDAIEFYNRGVKSTLACKKIEYFTKAIQLNPNLAEAYEKRAIHYFYQWQLDNAIEDYNRVIALKPDNANAYLMRGLSYFKKEYGEGFSAELKNLRFHLSNQEVPDYSKSIERAIDNFGRAIKIDPQLANAYAYRAEAYRVKGMIEKAMSDSNKAIQLGNNWHSTAKAYKTLSKIYGKLGRNDLSEVNFSKYITLDPNTENYPPLHVPLIFNYPSDSTSLKAVGRMGLIGIILLAIVAIFKLKLPPPRKKD